LCIRDRLGEARPGAAGGAGEGPSALIAGLGIDATGAVRAALNSFSPAWKEVSGRAGEEGGAVAALNSAEQADEGVGKAPCALAAGGAGADPDPEGVGEFARGAVAKLAAVGALEEGSEELIEGEGGGVELGGRGKIEEHGEAFGGPGVEVLGEDLMASQDGGEGDDAAAMEWVGDTQARAEHLFRGAQDGLVDGKGAASPPAEDPDGRHMDLAVAALPASGGADLSGVESSENGAGPESAHARASVLGASTLSQSSS